MQHFSPQLKKFLMDIGSDPDLDVSIVPKSISCAEPGDFLYFRYKLGEGKGSREGRLVLLVRPIVKDAKTGNQLLTVFRLEKGEYSPKLAKSLYKNKSIPEENYRTYIMSNIYGSLYRIRIPDEEEETQDEFSEAFDDLEL